jgi:hypothetical protein
MVRGPTVVAFGFAGRKGRMDIAVKLPSDEKKYFTNYSALQSL